MADHKNQDQSSQPNLASWIKSDSGKRAIARALERSRKETARLKEARAIDPKKYDEVITI